MRSILILALKDVRLLTRDKFGLFWILAFPLMYAMFFGAIFGGMGGGKAAAMPIALVDEDGSEESRQLVARLAKHESLAVEKREGGEVVLHDRASARDLVRKGRKTAFIVLEKGFGESAGFFGPMQGSALAVGVDPARSAEAGYLQGILMETLFRGVADSWKDKAAMRKQVAKAKEQIAKTTDLPAGQKLVLHAFMSALDTFFANASFDLLDDGAAGFGGNQITVLEVNEETAGSPRSSFEITFPSAIVWGLMGCAAGFAITIVRERTAGTLLRLRIAPIKLTQLLAGKALACFLCCVFVIVFLLAIAVLLPLRVGVDSPLLLAMAVGSTAACFTGMMLAMSVLGKTEQAVAGAGWGIMMPFAMLGGGMVPLIVMPSWMLTASHVSPFKWGILSIEGAIWRGFAFSEMLGPCALLLAIGAFFFGIGVWVFARTET